MQKLITFSIVLLLIFSASLIVANSAQASIFDQIVGGFRTTGQEAGYAETQFVPAWVNYINGLLFLMGALFAIMIIYGGWLWMSARGNEERVKKGQKILIEAIVGLGIIIGGRILFEFVVDTLGTAISPNP